MDAGPPSGARTTAAAPQSVKDVESPREMDGEGVGVPEPRCAVDEGAEWEEGPEVHLHVVRAHGPRPRLLGVSAGPGSDEPAG